jgi:hypothetical protein
MPNILPTPTVLYIIGIALITFLVVILGLSVYYYCKAKDIAPFLMRLEDLLRKIAEAQNTLEWTKHELRDKQDQLAKAEKLIADSKAAEEWLAENAPKVNALKMEVETEKQKLKDAADAYQKRQTELDAVTQQLADKNVEFKRVTELKDGVEILAARLGEDVKSLETTIRAKTQRLGELEVEIAKLTDNRNELDAQVKDLEKRIERLEKQLNEERETLDRRKRELATTNGELADVQGKQNEARRVLSELAEHRSSTAECWKDLDTPYIVGTSKPAESRVNEMQWLQDFSKKLDAHQIHFNERTVKAFHTGLKCADISPLVVLAGISGTGKSLLPELYAFSLGMNFLPVAVQPRWDSPQDMFGFYNYMEGRYKATELSRLLWQFDKYNNSVAAKNFKNQIPMNLVLLDEMNLARVEYYFSDLLSKLETRRGLDPDMQERRCKAEMEIECNASASKEQRRRLFVAGNTLFVGTMNEDESTQTLSDKVVDRANILRFGRPQNLGTKADKAGFLKEEQVFITHENWGKWLKRNEQRVAELKQILDPLNQDLERVGRPFAHRVWHAMEDYVAFYPGTTQIDFNAALADQIEMKIMPKLNGLEMDMPGFVEVKKGLSEIIAKVDDESLAKAFDTSCDASHSSFFKWRGVMR